MRYLVISDIHANLEALDAVLAQPDAQRSDRTLVLGDLVGYGPDPNAVVSRVRAMGDSVVIRGNHDKVACGVEPAERFNHYARLAVEWTARTLTRDALTYLAALPAGPQSVDDFVEICHGTPFDEDVYVFDDIDALRALRAASRGLCLFGHTHVATAFRDAGSRVSVSGRPGQTQEITVEKHDRWIVNCGAVGQPRDGDWRAAFGIVDTDTRRVSMRRVEYDVAATQAKIVAAGLPEVLAQRLSVGR